MLTGTGVDGPVEPGTCDVARPAPRDERRSRACGTGSRAEILESAAGPPESMTERRPLMPQCRVRLGHVDAADSNASAGRGRNSTQTMPSRINPIPAGPIGGA